jgi:hypothetical protein
MWAPSSGNDSSILKSFRPLFRANFGGLARCVDTLLTDPISSDLVFQVKNNMRIPTPNVKTYRSNTSPFVIDGLRVNGKRKQLFFATETAANQELARIKIKQRQEGEAALSLSDTTRIAALEGERKLAVFGKSLNWAVEFALKHLENTQKTITVRALADE